MDNPVIYIHAQNQVQSLTSHFKIVHDFIFLYVNHITFSYQHEHSYSYEDGKAVI